MFVFRHELALLRISAFMGLIILGGISRLFYTQLMGIFTVSISFQKYILVLFLVQLVKGEKQIAFQGAL